MSSAQGENLEELLAFAHRLADLSAEAILPHFRNLTAVDNKSGEGFFDPVTTADRIAEKVIRAEIDSHWPGHGLIGEEFGDAASSENYCWVIDPIDGTRPFILGLPVWGTLIGLLHESTPILGVMSQPFTGERFWATAGGAFYRGPDGERRIASRACTSLDKAMLTTTNPDMFARPGERERFEALAAKVKMRWFGGDCYGYCLLAAGHVDIIVESGLSAYDIAPLIPIVEAAGGLVTSWSGASAAKGGDVVACGDPVLHGEVMKVLAG